ncbi:DUF1330 domain-containing protein [Yinghuangia seranimata]|uniref:DUF1330 domain-containing protein n=1 Tax=Yinghuangia seranimata TaxID=408067 RepID=UPI00248CF6F7|nr:DUF1330 domain-containing protein [Yinghuangia seranimata]MDI2132949.1 DUF1330 domain-containing protein [Yinghuangia seranimata]
MTAYAIAHVRAVEFCPEIVEYLQRVDETIEPFGGRFIVHASPNKRAVEGDWSSDAIVIEFPSMEDATGWWDSPAYREILPLRTRNMTADIVLIEGCPAGYRAQDALKGLVG